jgi:hypothetical protein
MYLDGNLCLVLKCTDDVKINSKYFLFSYYENNEIHRYGLYTIQKLFNYEYTQYSNVLISVPLKYCGGVLKDILWVVGIMRNIWLFTDT